MTLSYKIRVLALLMSLVHSSYGALFAPPPPEANYCPPGICAVFHPPINKSHTICTWVPKEEHITNHVDNVNPDEICGLQGHSGFPNDTHGSWGGDGNRDSFCTALEVLKTNISNLTGSNATECALEVLKTNISNSTGSNANDLEIRCTQTNAYFCAVNNGCLYDVTTPKHHNKNFSG